MTSTRRPEAWPRGLLLLLLLPALCSGADTILDFDRWMQEIDRHSQGILRAIARQDTAQASEDAQALAELYRKMEGFYTRRAGADDAVLASSVGRDQAETALAALSRGDLERARAEASELSRDCRGCHLKFKPIRN